VSSAAEVILNDSITIPIFAALWNVDLLVTSYAPRATAALELRVGDGGASWQYASSGGFALPITTTITGSGGSGGLSPSTIPIYLRVWGNSAADSVGIINGQIHVEIQQIRVYNSFVAGDPLTEFTYKTASGMLYPVLGGTFDAGVPEPGSVALLVAGGLLLLVTRGYLRRRIS
jgi:hypothetical protein